MKVFIGPRNTCGLNYQQYIIYDKLLNSFEITPNVSEADAIVIAETCCCTNYNINYTLEKISNILKEKKKEAKVYLTGCITRTFKK